MAEQHPPFGNVILSGSKLITRLTAYINDIDNTPKYVEELVLDLMNTTTGLQELNLALKHQSERAKEGFRDKLFNMHTLLLGLMKALDLVEQVVLDSQIHSTEVTNDGELVNGVQWMWGRRQVESLSARLQECQQPVELILQLLSNDGAAETKEITQRIHDMILCISEDISETSSSTPETTQINTPTTTESSSDILERTSWHVEQAERFRTNENGGHENILLGPSQIEFFFIFGSIPIMIIRLGEECKDRVNWYLRRLSKRTPLIPQYLWSYSSGCLLYPLPFLEVHRVSAEWLELSPLPEAHPKRKDQGSLRLHIISESKTDELVDVLSKIIDKASQDWQLHCTKKGLPGSNMENMTQRQRRLCAKHEYYWFCVFWLAKVLEGSDPIIDDDLDEKWRDEIGFLVLSGREEMGEQRGKEENGEQDEADEP